MISIDDFEQILDDVAAELPQEFYRELNGGILLLPQVKYHEKSMADDFCVLGEYHVDRSMGRYIAIYYGSFMAVYGGMSKEMLRMKLSGTLRHEFRHHFEIMAGERDLEIQDEEDVAAYLQRKHRTLPADV